MTKNIIKTDLCVIGGGSGGLSVAAGAVQMGADTVLVEGGKMGGDCLNYGCVPSKALLAAAKHAVALKGAGNFGVQELSPEVNYPAVMKHVEEVIAGIEPHDSVERFEGLGVRVIQGYGKFTAPDCLEVAGHIIKARRFVIATGSSTALPPVPGLSEISYLTNETLFENRQLPDHLIVIGGGPIGMEMAQAHARLGAKVTVLEAFKALSKDDSELTKIALECIREDGVEIKEGVKIAHVAQKGQKSFEITLEEEGEQIKLTGSHVLVAAGRKPNVAGLGLEAAGVETNKAGIIVDNRLRTSNKKIFAIGDVAGGYQFTHIAGYHAGIVIRNILFKLPAKVNYDAVPWVTYTSPELANVGLTEAAARERYDEDQIKVLKFEYAENDRARAELLTTGMIKAIVHKNGKILGAGIVGAQAGELIQPWGLAISSGLKISSMASYISPYPTLGEINKRVAGSFYTPKLFSERTRKVVKFLQRLPF
ncbi:dihydrolipoyl dehydrogenase family protein [Sneathiella glossodoripedis]|uniref:dihydrolipoyl dehydrogenase family protein n=1 Tax=Sneathiella glossodoripedis TaxID=418853 RepID=UPI0004719B5D|nr:FAD-dependent oxidoreductase [Sneathiella glossodoripedis]